MRKHSLMAPDKLKSPFKFDYNRSGMHASHEVGDVYKNVGPLRKRASCQSAVEVHSARTANNKRTASGTREKADINLKQREFDLDKFRRLFGFKKMAEKRLHTEFALSNGDLTVANKKLNYSSQVQVPQAKPHPYLNLKKCQLQTNKISSVEKKSHRDKPTARSGLVQKIINGMKFDKSSKSRSRSKESELISQRSTSKSKSRPLRKHKKSQNNITPTNKMSTSRPLHQSGDIKLDDVEDIGFLFSKKLTNIEKMGMLNQRNKIVKENKEHKIKDHSDKINVKKLTVSLVKASRLATNYSGSDSLETMPMPMCDQKDNNDTSKDSEMENQEIENQLAQAQRSFCLRSSQLSSRTKAKVLNNHIESHENSPTKSKQKFSKNLFSRRRSFCEENQREKAQKELECALGPENISMTSELGGIDQKSSFDPSGSYTGGSGLQKSNCELLLRSIVSSSTNQLTTKDAYRLQEKVEEERQGLINYIKNNQQLNKGVPRTTLQFYKIVKLLGRGSFGKVHLGIHLLTRRKVAIKCIDKQYIMEEKAQGKVVQEINILKGLSHKNIIKVLEVFENKKYVFIVTDYAARGDLLQYMKEHGIFKEHKAKPIAAQILNGLEYIHGKGILHRDVKLDNILLTKDLKVKICDFGVSRHMPKGTQNIKERCGTPAYIAPEIIKNTGYYGFHADVREILILGVELWSIDICHGHWNNTLQG